MDMPISQASLAAALDGTMYGAYVDNAFPITPEGSLRPLPDIPHPPCPSEMSPPPSDMPQTPSDISQSEPRLGLREYFEQLAIFPEDQSQNVSDYPGPWNFHLAFDSEIPYFTEKFMGQIERLDAALKAYAAGAPLPETFSCEVGGFLQAHQAALQALDRVLGELSQVKKDSALDSIELKHVISKNKRLVQESEQKNREIVRLRVEVINKQMEASELRMAAQLERLDQFPFQVWL